MMPSLVWPVSGDGGGVSFRACIVAGHVGVSFGAVADGDVGGVGLAVAEVADLDGGAYGAGGDVVDEVIAVLDLVSADRGEDVVGLEAGLGSAAVDGVTWKRR